MTTQSFVKSKVMNNWDLNGMTVIVLVSIRYWWQYVIQQLLPCWY